MPDKLLSPEYGISKSKLEECTANPSDVMYGKTFYSGDNTKKTGTFGFNGSATTEQVVAGRTFYANSQNLLTGTLTDRNTVGKNGCVGMNSNYPNVAFSYGSVPQITSLLNGRRAFAIMVPWGWYQGSTYVGCDWDTLLNTIGNKGAWGTTINPGGSVTIPQGYHNGSGVVRANNPASGWRMRYFGGNADNLYHSQVIGAPDGNGTYAWGCSGYVYWGNENTHLAFDFQGQSYPDKMGNYNNFMFYGTNYFDSKTTLGYRIWGGNLNFYYCRVR